MQHVLSLARDSCIADPVLLWTIVLANALVFVAYIWIPVSIGRILSADERIPLPLLWVTTGTFILSCGCAHLAMVIVVFRPYYGLEAGVLSFTAGVSLIAAGILHRGVPVIRRALREYQDMVDRVRQLQADRDRLSMRLPE